MDGEADLRVEIELSVRDPAALDEPADQCFICLQSEPPLVKTKCACTNMWAHRTCLAAWVERSKSAACSVCKAEYENVLLRRAVHTVPSSYGTLLCLFAITNAVTFAAAIVDTSRYDVRTLVCTSLMMCTHVMLTIHVFVSTSARLVAQRETWSAVVV